MFGCIDFSVRVFNSLMFKHIYCLLTQSELHIYIILQSKIQGVTLTVTVNQTQRRIFPCMTIIGISGRKCGRRVVKHNTAILWSIIFDGEKKGFVIKRRKWS